MTAETLASHFDRLRGRLLGLIESWGLPAVQERGAKSILKSLSYDMEADLKEVFGAMQLENTALRARVAELEKSLSRAGNSQ